MYYIVNRLQLSSSKNISTVTKFLNSRFSISDPSEITIHIISTEICDTGSCICKGKWYNIIMYIVMFVSVLQ